MKVLLLSLYFSFFATGEPYRREKEARLIRINGDLILGGIFPMHEQVATLMGQSPCGAVKEEKGVQRLEAMLHALDLINEDTELLPNTTLGALIIDSCSSDTHALDQSMEFMRSYMNKDISDVKCEGNKSMIFTPIATKPVSSVIGASSSVVSIMIANILRLFKIPQVSYASTSTELSDKSRFEYFSRVVPPDNFQAQAMVEVISMMGWKYVSTVAVEGDYGEKGIATFTTLATTYQICVATYQKIMRNSRTDFDAIIQHLLSKNARAVVLFVDEDNVRKLLQATIRANRTGYFLWVGSDSWGAKVHPVRDQEYTAEGAITILPYRNVLEDFNEYFVNLRPKMGNECGGQTQNNVPHPSIAGKIVNCRNIWFREFWAQHHRCTFDTIQHVTLSNVTRCTGMEELIDYEQEGLVPFVEDAVYTMAHAIHNVIDEVCVNAMNTSHHLCETLLPAPNGSFLLQHIRNLSFIGRQNTEIKFNADGDAYGFYNIYQYQKNEDGHYDYILIGEWKEELILDINKTQWATGVGEQHIPNSICSENCLMGHVRNYIGGPCCWTCLPCRDEEYVVNDTCKSCDLGLAPDETKIGCVKIAPEVLPWISPWVLVPLICASIGIVFTIFTLCVFLRFNNTPAIRASGRELCYVLLAGILSCYSMSFVILSKPTSLNCTCLRIGLGLCLNMCYSAILTKTNRISRIFNKGGSNIKNVPYTSPTSQVLITIGIISVQLVGSMAWLIFEPPDVTEIYPYPMSAVLKCSVSTFSLMMSLLFNIILILLCTFYAFKTRKIPADYNEAKYIGFTMYSTCIVWLAFVPIYFGTNNEHKVQLTSLSMCVNISASVVLGCLFGPKVYLCLFQPQKNVRRPHVLPNTGLYSSDTRGAYSMRFAGGRSETMQSVTSISRSSPSMSRAGGRTNERKHGNGETQAVASPSIEETSVN